MTLDPPLQGEGDRGAQRRGGGALPQKAAPVVERARRLRREMSLPEVLLWQRLRGSPEGMRFRRQHPIGSEYVVDFYCPARQLVIEVDGAIHDNAAAQQSDARRDAYLRARGLEVLRIKAGAILSNADAAAQAVVALAATPLHHHAAHDGPPPRAGEDQGS